MSGNPGLRQNTGKGTPIPVFNYRKRPRQAVIADPKDVQKSSKFSGDNEFSSVRRLEIGGIRDGWNKNTPNYQNDFSQQKESLQQKSLKFDQGNRNFHGHQNSGSNLSMSYNKKGSHSSSVVTSQTNNSYMQNATHFGRQPLNMNMVNPPKLMNVNLKQNNNSGILQQNVHHDQSDNVPMPGRYQQTCFQKGQIAPRNQQGFGMQQSNQNFNTGQMMKTCSNRDISIPQVQRSSIKNFSNGCRDEVQFTNTNTTATFSTKTQDLPKQVQGTNIKRDKALEKKKLDASLHMLTLSISRVHYWSKYNDIISMMFEVFGVIDSAVTRDTNSSYKEFTLRDDQHKMRCVFYEIDRDLPKLYRGHLTRCIGTYNLKNQLFKCVSVRAATIDEKDYGCQQAENTEGLLKQMMKQYPEQ